ncbi:Uncharacterised protein [Salmonella enterica subsp. enterica serovar Typhi]|nr:Uncharacterised protein [Salmonella enterica subsp. enterica serovar Typhi]
MNQRIRVDRAAGIQAATRHPLTQKIAFTNQRQIALGVDKAMFCGANHQIASRILRLVQA